MLKLHTVGVCVGAAVVLCLSAVAAHAAIHPVPAGGDLQAALHAAQPGDVILLESGATYIGNFKLPVKDGADFITVRTDAPARQLPRQGVRTSPAYAPLLAKIKSPNSTAALTTAEGAHHWRFEHIEFQANVNGAGDIITIGASSAQTQYEQMPHDIVFDRVYIHGDPIVGQKRGIALNGGYTEVLNSHIADIKSIAQDSQAIAGWNGSGPYLIENNYLEGAGENVLFGGSDPAVKDLVPSDITIRGNLFTKPLQWRNEKWQVKNLFELKSARRVLVEGNVFEHSWVAAQTGFAVLFSTRNQDGKAPWSVVEDVTFRYNIIRKASNAINISGTDYTHPSQQGRRYQISHNVIHDIGGPEWGGSGTFLLIGNEPRDVTVEHNTVFSHSGLAVSVYGTRSGRPAVVDGFAFHDNLMRHNQYGVKGPSLGVGHATFDAYFRNVAFVRNVLAGGDASKYPGDNFFPSVVEFEGLFVNPARGDFRLVSGSHYRFAASDGGAIGADIGRVNAAVSGGLPQTQASGFAGGAPAATEDEGRSAVCRPASGCDVPASYTRRR